MKIDAIWITWERHRRTRSLTDRLGIELRELDAPGSFPLRHLLLACRTLVVLMGTTQPVVFVQNPSLILALVAVLVRGIRGWCLVVDAHNEAVDPFIGTSGFRKSLSDWLIREANLTVVTNPSLASRVRQKGGVAAVLPDPVPTPGRDSGSCPVAMDPGARHILMISTDAPDEPLAAILEAVASLPGVVLHVSGDHRRGAYLPVDLASRVNLTGYLADADYWNLLRSVDAVVDLTLMADCLVCGAYEAVATRTPAVLSDGLETRRLFSRGCVYATPDPPSIHAALVEVLARRDQLAAELDELAGEMDRQWRGQASELERTIAGLVTAPAATDGPA